MELDFEKIFNKLKGGNPHALDNLTLEQLHEFCKWTEFRLNKIDFMLIGLVAEGYVSPRINGRDIEEIRNNSSDYKQTKQVLDFALIKYKERMAEHEPKEVLNEFEFKEAKQKILFLERIGVIDFIRKEFSNPSNGKIGEILKPVTGIAPDTIRKYLENIQTGNIKSETENSVMNLINELKLKINKTK